MYVATLLNFVQSTGKIDHTKANMLHQQTYTYIDCSITLGLCISENTAVNRLLSLLKLKFVSSF